jgi:thiosulfate/3-mercaptopyruvate sulfurtransferase
MVSGWGIAPGTQVVVYDDSSGSMAAARLWWLLHWAGHEAAAVLDGGFQRWVAAGFPCESGAAVPGASAESFTPRFCAEMAVDAGDVLAVIHDPDWVLLDARAADRYRGENETIDPVAGHIPGAVSAPWQDNMAADGSFKSPGELQERLEKLTGGRGPSRTVLYCGSGVTAAHEALAFVHAGKGMPRLYAGSWSHWITDPARPVAK